MTKSFETLRARLTALPPPPASLPTTTPTRPLLPPFEISARNNKTVQIRFNTLDFTFRPVTHWGNAVFGARLSYYTDGGLSRFLFTIACTVEFDINNLVRYRQPAVLRRIPEMSALLWKVIRKQSHIKNVVSLVFPSKSFRVTIRASIN